jgi:hypothetical protein
MMRDRRLHIMAENQALMMRAMAEFLLAQRVDEGNPRLPPHVEKLALKILSRGQDLEDMIEDGLFSLEAKEDDTGTAPSADPPRC